MIQFIVTGTIKAAEVKIPPGSLQLVVLCWSPTYGLGSDSESFISAKEKTKLLEHYISLNFNFARSFFKFANTGFGLPAS